MTNLRGSAAYKKKDGTLTISNDGQSVSWMPVAPPGSPPALVIQVSKITNLQQLPPTSPKVMLKIIVLTQPGKDPEPHAFTFTSPIKAREEAESIKDGLSKLIQAAKPGIGVVAPPSNGGKTTSAAMAIAGAVSSLPSSSGDPNAWYDDGRLKADIELQQSLLKATPSLSKTFMESLRLKPDSITNSQFTSQFWSTRIHLLRAYAVERTQIKGAYNVLSTIKIREDNSNRLTISKEQIQLIFNQHSLVKRVYDENVPRLSEEAFWSAFFQSRLFKKLKGEKISPDDPTNAILDRYLQCNDDEERNQRLEASHVSHIIDVEGNEENHSQRKGNMPDFTMRPAANDRVPIIRTLNAISEKIMSHVPPNDIDPSLPIGVDEETFNQLALRDLQAEAEEKRVVLNVKDQDRFFSSNKETDISADALLYAQQDPIQVLRTLRTDMAHLSATPTLSTTLGIISDSDGSSSSSSSSSPSRPPKKKKHVGSKSSRARATSQILAAIMHQRAQTDDHLSGPAPAGLSPLLFDRISLTHATTTEFLQHFWSAFLSGDANRAGDLAKLLETLDRAMDRIQAVADAAEQERTKEVDRIKQQLKDRYERTQRKVKFDFESIGGGAKAVNQLLAPTVKAIQVAGQEYRKALAAAENGNGAI